MYSSSLHQEGLAHLLYGIRGNGGFVALTGEVGTGKTLLCHCLLEHLPENVDIALILNPRMDAIELIASICDELDIYYAPSAMTLKHLIDALNKYLLFAHSRGRHTVLMIDEAQNLTLDVLEQVRLLTNLETATEKLLQIILVGQPELQAMLERPDLRQLNQRITARYHLHALDLDDTRKYIQHRLTVCRGRTDIFDDAAIKLIYKLTGGLPRLINTLCDRALLGAYTLGVNHVDPKIVRAAAKEIPIKIPLLKMQHWGWPLLWLCLAVGLLLNAKFDIKQIWHDWYVASFAVEPATEAETASAPMLPQHDKSSEKASAPTALTTPPASALKQIAPPNSASTSGYAQLKNQKRTDLSTALLHALPVFNKNLAETRWQSCESIESYGVHCLYDRSSLANAMTLRRPIILEFKVDNRKIYALLKSFKDKKVILQANTEITLELADLLANWDGYFIVLWQSPFPGVKEITPHETSNAVRWLRQLLNFPAKEGKDNFFDDALRDKVIEFQRQHKLFADGVAGGRTLIHLQNQQASSPDAPAASEAVKAGSGSP